MGGVVNVAKRDTRTDREKLLDTIAKAEREQAELLGKLSTAGEAEHEACVAALTADPSKRSDAAGAASPVRKIAEQAVRDRARLENVESELRAGQVALAVLDENAAAVAREGRVRLNIELRKRETVTLDALRATVAIFAEQFAVYRQVVDERVNAFGGTDDPMLQPVIRPALSAAELFRHLEQDEADGPREVGTFPAPAPAGAVVPIRRGDPRWLAARTGGVA
jgi:hypothetical protein